VLAVHGLGFVVATGCRHIMEISLGAAHLGLNKLPTPAYGGWVYYPSENGFIVLQVRAKPASPPGE
jgi:hypothetical protein